MGKWNMLKDMVKKVVFNKTLQKGAKFITDASGGSDLADYAGSKLAKLSVPNSLYGKTLQKNIPDKTSGLDALKSAGRVGITLLALKGAQSMTNKNSSVQDKVTKNNKFKYKYVSRSRSSNK
ncbi:MAG: hypothetical protein WC917_04070 [Bacilli bacterium]|jgi:hypothetical protein